jgi:hypothetical protein
MRRYIVYKTVNLVTGRVYVGAHATNNLNDGYLGSGVLLKRAVEKYGRDSFERSILFECDNEEEMFAKEREIVNIEFVSSRDTYNAGVGGRGGSLGGGAPKGNQNHKGHKHSENALVKMRQPRTKRDKFGKHCAGVKLSEEHKQKISASMKAYRLSQR